MIQESDDHTDGIFLKADLGGVKVTRFVTEEALGW